MNDTHSLTYTVPFRAIWLQQQDLIEIRFRPASPADERIKLDVDAIVGNYRLLGVQIVDNKRLGIGRWLRQNYTGTPHPQGDPSPSGEAVYNEAAQVVYFSLWPRLSAGEAVYLSRKAEIDLDGAGNPTRIRMRVLGRRRKEDELTAAAGFLPER
ncbi:MAG: hypothetical protein KJZ86_11890 [Caldilineaceae bacterium]|nr:hypothetical protein [Caldilineaceae bacterium]